MCHLLMVNCPALKDGASWLSATLPQEGAHTVSAGVDYPVRAVPALQHQIVYSGCLVLATSVGNTMTSNN